RLQVLTWLKQPVLVESGATADAVAARVRMSGPVARTHLGLLTALGLLHVDRSDGPPRYRRDEVRIAEVARMSEKGWQHGRGPARGSGPPARRPGRCRYAEGVAAPARDPAVGPAVPEPRHRGRQRSLLAMTRTLRPRGAGRVGGVHPMNPPHFPAVCEPTDPDLVLRGPVRQPGAWRAHAPLVAVVT